MKILNEKINAKQIQDFKNEIKLNKVTFRYENTDVIKDLNIKITKGQSVALVGQSGSGKSTIANLICRFYDINEGSITIDGVDIKNLKKKSLRDLIGLVTQDAILFNDSIKNKSYAVINDSQVKEFGVSNIKSYSVDYPSKDEIRIINLFKGKYKFRIADVWNKL